MQYNIEKLLMGGIMAVVGSGSFVISKDIEQIISDYNSKSDYLLHQLANAKPTKAELVEIESTLGELLAISESKSLSGLKKEINISQKLYDPENQIEKEYMSKKLTQTATTLAKDNPVNRLENQHNFTEAVTFTSILFCLYAASSLLYSGLKKLVVKPATST